MKITLNEPATGLQEIVIENVEVDEVDILKTILELLNLQFDYYTVHKYYADRCIELTSFDKIIKGEL